MGYWIPRSAYRGNGGFCPGYRDLAQRFDIRARPGRRLLVSVAFILPATAGAALLDDILAAADQGQCIESITFRLIKERGSAEASPVVDAALNALAQRDHQQRVLGCVGDVAAQAIAAGADPGQVLDATAAGL